ncbi:MAG: GAF domain-containing protein [Gemmataceae bacterium]
MALLVPEKTIVQPINSLFPELSDLLVCALEFLGASAGWIGLQDGEGRWTFPVHAGVFPSSWLDWQRGRDSVWGVAVGSGPTLLNDLRLWPTLGDPPLHNLLSCPLIHNDQILGHVVLANKPHGFAAEDAAVLQGLAHHMVRFLQRRLAAARTPMQLSAAWRRILDRADEAVLLLDASGTLIYVNAIWLDWTAFRAEELLGRTAPFPFWIRAEDLKEALPAAPVVPERALPFRRRDQSLFWCLLETESQRWHDHILTVVFLRQSTALSPLALEGERCNRADQDEARPLRPAKPDWLPLLLDLDGGIEGWGVCWEERTGLSARDVEGSRSDLVLDWLFPRQHDREGVVDCFQSGVGCQLNLEIATPSGSRLVLCTFLPWATAPSTTTPRRWLLLIGESIDAARLDGAIRLEPSGCLFDPHPCGEPTAPIVPPDQTEPRP